MKLSRRVVGTSVRKSQKRGTKDGSGIGLENECKVLLNFSSFVPSHCFKGVKRQWWVNDTEACIDASLV